MSTQIAPPYNNYCQFYKSLKSFADYRKAHLSKIYTYQVDNKNTIYFYFFRRKRSQYFDGQQLAALFKQYDKNKEELKDEFKKLKLK